MSELIKQSFESTFGKQMERARLFYQKKVEYFRNLGDGNFKSHGGSNFANSYIPNESVVAHIMCEFHEKEIEENNTLYEFLYNSCIHESAAATMSIHRTQKGAEIAMEFHKNEARKKWDEDSEFEFGTHEYWGVRPIKLLD